MSVQQRRGRWTSFVADTPFPTAKPVRGLHEATNPRHRLRVEHDDNTLLIHLSDEDGDGWTTIAVDRSTRRWAVAQGARQSDTARTAHENLYRLTIGRSDVAGGDLVDGQQTVPVLQQVVLDCTNARELAEFYRQLLGLQYRPGDEPPAGDADSSGADWLVLQDADGRTQLAFQQVAELPPATWPEGPVPQQLHLDLTVPTARDLDAQHARALALGARLLLDRSTDPHEPLYVYADPAGHPFCIFVG